MRDNTATYFSSGPAKVLLAGCVLAWAACSSKPPPQAPFVSHIPYLGLECGQLEEAEKENITKLGDATTAFAEAQREECDVSAGDILIWGVFAGAVNDDDVCRELETEILRLQATSDAIIKAQEENECTER